MKGSVYGADLKNEDHMHIENLPLEELRKKWAKAWNLEPHRRIGRKMLQRSLAFKVKEKNGNGLSSEHEKHLTKLVNAYKKNPYYFDEGHIALKPGMHLTRKWQGNIYSVTVTDSGFDYQNVEYSSLSAIANEITGSRWNGWLFFGIKNMRSKT